MKWDGFDFLVITAVAVLMAASLAYSLSGGEARATSRASARACSSHKQASPAPPDIYPRLSSARTLLDAGQVKESAAALTALETEFPAEPETHALLGQAYARLGDYPQSMREFKSALVIDPDYVDKKSEKFIGKRIRAAVKEGMDEAKAELARNPDDAKARAELDDAYYIKKMLAGGCE